MRFSSLLQFLLVLILPTAITGISCFVGTLDNHTLVDGGFGECIAVVKDNGINYIGTHKYDDKYKRGPNFRGTICFTDACNTPVL